MYSNYTRKGNGFGSVQGRRNLPVMGASWRDIIVAIPGGTMSPKLRVTPDMAYAYSLCRMLQTAIIYVQSFQLVPGFLTYFEALFL